MGNWLLVQADSRRRRVGSNWESKNAEAESAYCAIREPGPHTSAAKAVLLLNGLMSRLKPRLAGVRRWRNPKSPGQPRPFYTCAFAPGRRAPWATKLAREEGFFVVRLGGLLRMTAYGIGDALTCGGWRRGRARGRGAEREDAIARGRMRARSRSCCRRPDTRFSR